MKKSTFIKETLKENNFLVLFEIMMDCNNDNILLLSLYLLLREKGGRDIKRKDSIKGSTLRFIHARYLQL